MAGLYAPLPTLRSHPRGGLRTDRGRRGLLLLHRSGLSPHTPCRSPGALTHVAVCTLAQSPYFVTAIRRLQTFRYLHDCSGCCRRERIAGWASHPLESAALSRRTPTAAVRRTIEDRRGSTHCGPSLPSQEPAFRYFWPYRRLFRRVAHRHRQGLPGRVELGQFTFYLLDHVAAKRAERDVENGHHHHGAH